ncbi:MAG: ATP-binding cassette domain-containing protein, partial [Muribaculum sp.]|nr:ATP-binding cassette domain-containing protein [Muribaculum sp.]
MIKLTNVEKRYRVQDIETLALENINIDIEQGTFVSIMGPSGCGKSTLLNITGLLDVPTAGTVEIMGTNMDKMNDNKLSAFRNANLGFIFQSFHLIPSLSV